MWHQTLKDNKSIVDQAAAKVKIIKIMKFLAAKYTKNFLPILSALRALATAASVNRIASSSTKKPPIKPAKIIITFKS